MLAVSSLGIPLIEHKRNLSLFDSFWLNIVTLTTVSYRDLWPRITGRQKMERREVCLQRTMNLR
jgi:hypothetical protein